MKVGYPIYKYIIHVSRKEVKFGINTHLRKKICSNLPYRSNNKGLSLGH
jgi:hypothetical protein